MKPLIPHPLYATNDIYNYVISNLKKRKKEIVWNYIPSMFLNIGRKFG